MTPIGPSPAWYSEPKARIALAKALARRGGYSDLLVDVVGQISIGHATTTRSLDLEAAFRARKIGDDDAVIHLSQVWHPRPDQLKTFGRANLPFAPVLYCCDGASSAIREIGGAAGDRIALLEMGLADQKMPPNICSLGEMRARKKAKRTEIIDVRSLTLDSLLERLGAADARAGIDLQRTMLIDGFYADIFRAAGREFHPLTAAISQVVMAPDEVDGISYPTVADPTGQNFALKPASAARLLAVRVVKIVRLIRPLGNSFFVRDENVSSFLHPDGRIEWLKPLKGSGSSQPGPGSKQVLSSYPLPQRREKVRSGLNRRG